MRKYFLSTFVTAAILITSASAAPVKVEWGEYTQPDGTTITLRLCGDEYHHYYMTEEGNYVMRDADGYFRYTVINNNELIAGDVKVGEQFESVDNAKIAERHATLHRERRMARESAIDVVHRAPMRRVAQQAATDDGETRGLIILVEFQDLKFQVSQSKFDDMMNKEDYTDEYGSIGSAHDYFEAQSYGQFMPKFDIVGPVTLENNVSYYGQNNDYGNDIRPDEMVTDACEIASAQGLINMADYDSNNDGWVDLVYIIYAGCGENVSGVDSNRIWPHAWYVYSGAGRTVTIDGVTLNAYACSAELNNPYSDAHDGIGTFCHEFSHTLGLPDWYDIDYSGAMGMSSWSVMDSGCYSGGGYVPIGYNAYERAFCGWIELNELTEPISVTMPNLNEDATAAYRVSSNDEDQYITIECRRATGWDAGLPASGMMVVAVDYDKSAWDRNGPNDSPSRQRFKLIPADNDWSNYSLSGDLYPASGNNKLTSTSAPKMQIHNTVIEDKPITNIKYKDGVATFDFMGGKNITLDTPVATSAGDITPTSFTAYWSPVQGATSYDLYVEHYDADYIPQVAFEENFDKFTASAAVDVANELDIYTNQTGWSGYKVFCNNGSVKLGSSKGNGYITTPYFTTVTDHIIYMSACAYDTDAESGTLTITVSYDGGTAACEIAMSNFPAGELIPFGVSSQNSGEECTVTISADARIYIDDLYIEHDIEEATEAPRYMASLPERDGVKKPTLKKSGKVLGSRTIEGITGTSFTVTEVVEPVTYGTYRYKVKAKDSEGESEWSNMIEVVIPDSQSSVEDNLATDMKVYAYDGTIYVSGCTADTATIYNMQGAVVATINTYNGKASYEVTTAGIYIVRCNDKATKVLVR